MSLFARPKTNYGLDTPQTGGVGSGRASQMFGRRPVPPTVYGRGMMSAEQQRRDHYQQSGGVPPVKMPTYGADGTPIYEPKFYEQMRRNNQAGGPAGVGYPPMPNAPEGAPATQPYAPMGGTYSPLANSMAQNVARQRMGIAPGGAAPPPVSPWGQVQQNPANTGIDPARIFRYPELAGVASSMDAYQGMANQHDRMAAGSALANRNIGVYEQMGQPNRGLEAARGQADSILGGASAARPRRLADGSYDTAPVLSPEAAAAAYGNSPLAGVPMVKPRFGQTTQEAQREYMNIRNTVPGQTQARVAEMLSGPDGNNLSIPGRVQGTYTGPSGVPNAVMQRPDGSVRIQGPQSQSQWGSQLSGLPDADGRTNAEMAKERRENVAGARQDRRDASIIARAGQLGQRPTQNLGLFKSMQRQGMPMRGMPSKPGEQSGVTAPATVGEAVKTLQDFSQSPLGLQISESMGFDAANAKDPDWARVLSREDLVNLSEPDIRELQKASIAARAGGMGLNPGSGTLELMTAFETGGPSAALKVAKRQAVDSRHKTGPGYQYKPQVYGLRPATH